MRTLSALLPSMVTTGVAGGVVAGGVVGATVGGTVTAVVAVAVALAPGKTVRPGPGKARARGATNIAIIATIATTVAPVSRRFIQPLHLTPERAEPGGTHPDRSPRIANWPRVLRVGSPVAGACMNEPMVRRLGQAVNLGRTRRHDTGERRGPRVA